MESVRNFSDSEFLGWIDTNQSALGLRIIEIQALSEFIPGLYDFAATASNGIHDDEGRGLSFCRSEALAKACAELVERLVFSSGVTGKSTTSGLAAHPILAKAMEGAVWEIVERDAFLCHYLTKTPFLRLDPVIHDSIAAPFQQQIMQLTSLGFSFHLREMAGDHCGRAFIACCFTPKRGCVVGLGCGPEQAGAAFKAITECLCGAIYQRNINEDSLSLNEFCSIGRTTQEQHRRLALSPESGSSLEPLIFGDFPDFERKSNIDAIVIQVVSPHPPFSVCPIHFAQASGGRAFQELYFGESTPARVNIERLSDFMGQQVSWNDIQKLPHPLA